MMPTPWPLASEACPDQVVVAPVVLVGAVAHVQPGDVHAGIDQLADHLRRADGRAEGAHDLGSPHGVDPSRKLDRSKHTRADSDGVTGLSRDDPVGDRGVLSPEQPHPVAVRRATPASLSGCGSVPAPG